ncbi:hypothetical protein BDFB_007903 [Asbolus verrucosus]|uniref:Uncharacterized protein n=1 Tax=Asbolus verrucosus TaxID=1661398 RepID=A0A482VW99_ASBVE|nr:hypothetical protein BDFB_007903 [Asbolus verrucosus]
MSAQMGYYTHFRKNWATVLRQKLRIVNENIKELFVAQNLSIESNITENASGEIEKIYTEIMLNLKIFVTSPYHNLYVHGSDFDDCGNLQFGCFGIQTYNTIARGKTNTSRMRKINLFSLKLLHKNFEFSASGFFKINASLLQTILTSLN